MSQKSILSFFKQTDKPSHSKKPNDSSTSSIEREDSADACYNSSKQHNGFKLTENESPIKQSRKRKARLLDSDEESNHSQDEASNTVKNTSEEMEVDASFINQEGLQNNKSTPLNGEAYLSRKESPNHCQSDEIEESSSKKIKLENNSSPTTSKVLKNLSESILNSEAPSSSELYTRTSKLPPPPKRKTARKSMKATNTVKISSSPEKSKNSKDILFPSVKTYNKKNVKKVTNSIKESSSDDNESCEDMDAANRMISEIKPHELKESEKEFSEKISSSAKPQTIHPFFVHKDKKISLKDKAAKKSEKSEKIADKDKCCAENESSSPPSKKYKTEIINENTSKKSELSATKDDNSLNEKSGKKALNSSSTSSGVLYDPSKSKYHPIDDACWKRNEKVPYLALAKTLELIENTSARLKIVEILANYLRSVIVLTPDDLLQSVYLCLNRIAPEYEGIELGVGDMVLMKAVAQATGRTLDKIRAEVKEKGDLGLIAESSRGKQKVMFAPPKLTVASVFSKFKEIAKMSGNAAMAKKTDKIQALFVACRDCEAKYIIRSLSGKLRIGLAEQSVLAALGRAVVLTPPGQSYPPEVMDKSTGMSSEKFKKLQDEKTLILKTTYCECPNYDLVIPVLLKEGIDHLPEHCQLSPGCPLKPMLAHPTNGIDEVLQRFDNNDFTCEFKYDGERAQIHRTDKGEIKIFSRNQEDNTTKYPDIIARLSKALKGTTTSFILDSEAVAWNQEKRQILPFQILSTRKKKDADKSEIVVQVCVMAFDLLYLNGESLVKKPLKERRALLHSSFVEVSNEFMFVTYKDGNSAETMQEFLDESIKGNCEGLMVKALEVDASYEIAKRSHNWLKLKKDYLDGVGDTLDLVVIGGYHGKGKRTGTYGGFLLACYDHDNEEFQSICKLGTGFKEDELEAHTKFLKNHVIDAPKSYYRFDHSLEPDEWFEPEQLWEVKCADLSISPIHKAAIGLVDPEKGISLRFPRFLRIRDDKKIEEATNSSQVSQCEVHDHNFIPGRYSSSCIENPLMFEPSLQRQLNSLRVRPTFCIAFASYTFLEDFEEFFPTYVFAEPDKKKSKSDSTLHKRKYLNSIMKTALGSYLPSHCTMTFAVAPGIIGSSKEKIPVEIEDGFALSGFCFPSIPGVEIHHFAVDGRKCNLSDLIPKETRVKCLLAFLTPRGTSIIDKLVQSCLVKEECKVAVGGAIVDRTESLLGSVIAFCGENIEASSLIIGRNDKHEAELKNKLKMFQETGLLKNRCYAFMFACVARGYSLFEQHNYESTTFHSMYPNVPLIGVFGNGEIGVNYFPHVPTENKLFQLGKFTRSVKKYLHSYTTVFMLISIKE